VREEHRLRITRPVLDDVVAAQNLHGPYCDSELSEENVEVVRRIHERWSRGESVRDLLADDMEYVNPTYAVEPGTRIGAKTFGIVRETYPDFQLNVERLVDTDGDDVVVLGHYTASGGESGVPLTGEHGYVWTIRDGLAVRFKWFQSHDEALAAAGVGT
jgi:ketosteroid isomerase-like protein